LGALALAGLALRRRRGRTGTWVARQCQPHWRWRACPP